MTGVLKIGQSKKYFFFVNEIVVWCMGNKSVFKYWDFNCRDMQKTLWIEKTGSLIFEKIFDGIEDETHRLSKTLITDTKNIKNRTSYMCKRSFFFGCHPKIEAYLDNQKN